MNEQMCTVCGKNFPPNLLLNGTIGTPVPICHSCGVEWWTKKGYPKHDCEKSMALLGGKK